MLANPRIRVKNKEKARVHIGDRVPVITTTAAATGGFVSESVSYLDVGLKLEVEPLIYLEDEVGIKVALEVSNIAREIRTVGSSTLAYQIGTRNAATMLRLRDGETQILAGLISDEDRKSADRVPGLGDLPVSRAPVLAYPRQRGEDRDRAAHHAAPGAHAGAPGGARHRVRRRHRGIERTRRASALPPIPFPSAPATPATRGDAQAADRCGPGAVRRGPSARMKQRGFTLIELVIAVAIVAILASAALPLNELVVQRAKEQDLRRALREIRAGLDAYKQASDDGRLLKKVGESGYPKRLEDLAEGVEDQKNPKARAHLFPAPRAARSFRRALGQAQLCQPARRSARRRGRFRRVQPRARQGHQRAPLQRMVMRKGFTLIELLVVLAIIATLLTLAVPRYYASIDKSKEAVLKENL